MQFLLIVFIACLNGITSRRFDPLKYEHTGYLYTVAADWNPSHQGCIEQGYENIGWLQCPSGRCIPWRRSCDDNNDCGDNYDENNFSFCAESLCKGNNITCDVQTGVPQCLPPHTMCDGKIDCEDFADENRDTCSVRCTNKEYPCKNGRCIPLTSICDNKNDCGDNSDEQVPGYCDEECHHRCNDGSCIPYCCLCDGFFDCSDGSDEKDCTEDKCAPDELPCFCLPLRLKCDQITDCTDFEDEDPNECQGPQKRQKRSSVECITKDSGDGQCVAIQKCPEALKWAAKGVYPQLCHDPKATSFSVCCALEKDKPVDVVEPTRLEDFAAICGLVDREPEYLISRHTIGNPKLCNRSPHPSIPGETISWCRKVMGVLPVGGTNVTSATHFPWMVTLGVIKNNKYVNKCGGTLITDRHVLTAAHCFVDGSITVARVSELNLDVTYEANHVDRQIKAVHRHPQFKFPQVYNDIAILVLSTPLPLSRFIRPVCLPSGPLLPPGTNGYTIGFGDTSFGGTPTAHLQEIYLPIIDQKKCESSYAAAPSLFRRRYPSGIKETMFCAGLEYGGRDSCQGDSGSGFVSPTLFNKMQKTVWGVVSFGLGCGSSNYPGIYTSVVHYLQWIKETVEAP